jgi:hypothetical protein
MLVGDYVEDYEAIAARNRRSRLPQLRKTGGLGVRRQEG